MTTPIPPRTRGGALSAALERGGQAPRISPRPPPVPVCDDQLALTTPGISPRCASSRRPIRHKPNFRNTARGRRQPRQREYLRTLNLGVRFHFSSIDFLATL